MQRQLRLAVAVCTLVLASGCQRQANPPAQKIKVRFGISPFQDTLLPIVGKNQNWYAAEGLDVEFKVLGWSEVMEGLSAGAVDVAISNMSSVVATHSRNPDIVYYYGLNPFDNGFALMIRPNGPLKSLAQISHAGKDRSAAVHDTAAQLKGRKVITTGNTDMEQGVAAAARRGGLNFERDLRILDLNPDEGLAAFLRGEGDAYIGGIPQRTRATQDGMVEMLTGADLGPPPINGFVTTKRYMRAQSDVLLRLLHVWFRCVRFVDNDKDQGAQIIIRMLNSYSAANFTVQDFKRYWNHYEYYPATPKEVQQLILDPSGRNYWKLRWDDCNDYFFRIRKSIPAPVNPDDAFLMIAVHHAYTDRFGDR